MLLQAYISHLKLEGFALMSDMVYVTQVSFYEEKGVRFKRNCGAASVGEYSRVIWYYPLS